jgi:hypothetical protein
MATIRKLISKPLRFLAFTAMSCLSAAVIADPAQCQLKTVSQEFEWSRQFHGIPTPITWKISRQVQFEATRQEGIYRVDESLKMELPEFRSKFARYLASAKLDSCELRFSVAPRTPTAHGSGISMPIKVQYEAAKCKYHKGVCRNRGYEFHSCPKNKRKITNSDAAEIDVDFTIELTKPKLESVVSWEQAPFYSDLFEPAARSLFEQVLNDGSAALAFITGTLGTVSIASFSEDLQAIRLNGQFTSPDATIYQADASYELNSTQACAVREKLLDQYPDSIAPVSP